MQTLKQLHTFKPSGQTLAALLLSILMSLMIFLLIRYSQTLNPVSVPQLNIRKVVLAPAPPPPPPPVQQRAKSSSTLQLDLNAGTAATTLEIKLDAKTLVLATPALPEPQYQQQLHWDQDLNINWTALSLDQLDNLPQLLALDNPVFPQQLARRNVSSVIVRLDILIDEAGRVSLIRVNDNPYPALLDSAIRSLVRSARFSVPMQNGKPARTRFIWPVELKP